MKRLHVALAVGLLAACGAGASQPAARGAPATTPDASTASTDAGAPSLADSATNAKPDASVADATTAPASDGGDPFAAQPDESQGLTNVSSDLNALLENGALPGACAAYQAQTDAGAVDTRTMLLCGKWMFFYGTFGTFGIPSSLVQFLATNFPNQLGLGFSKLGLVPDPASTTNMPLGLAPTTPTNGTIPAVAFTCASCHFSQLSDGRYAVGAPNHGYDYAAHILSIALVPTLATGLSQASAHDPSAVARVQPVLDALSQNATLKSQLLVTLLPLIGVKQPSISTQEEGQYAEWLPGTLDFLIAPLPIDDQVHTISKMAPLWGIPRPAEAAAAGMSSGLLAWTGDVSDLYEFLNGFAVLGGSTSVPTPDQLSPLVEYLYSLRAPSNPSPPDPSLVSQGEAVFESAGCVGCHAGPRGSGKQAYTFTDVGTDPALARWADPNLTGEPCCGVPQPKVGMLTHGVKSPRLVGMWAQRRFLHNGSLSSLDELLCSGTADAGDDGGRPAAGAEPQETVGHTYGCSTLTDAQKQALIAYLLAH